MASIVTTNGRFGFFGLGSLMGVALITEPSVDARCVEAHEGLFELVVVKEPFEDCLVVVHTFDNGAHEHAVEYEPEVVELVVFLVPLVVENPDANDNNFNKDERARLRLLSNPLEQSSEQLLSEGKFFKNIKNNEVVNPALEPIDETTGPDPEQQGTP